MENQLPSNSTLSHYRIVSKIGAGGMGQVYLAEDLKLGRQVALKVLNDDLTANNEHVQRFEREARAASALSHPNILTIYEIGETADSHFIVTEFVEGDSLRRVIRRGNLSLTEILDLGIQIASALAAAHGAGIVHRDIKPENIMVRKDRLVKVLDFGLAKLLEPETVAPEEDAVTRALLKTSPGIVMGTTAYMSPEQARGKEVDERTDIWSLGVVLHQLITGELPFAGETPSDIIAAILKAEPPRPEHPDDPVPEELAHIVSKALRKNREDRYQHVKDLLIDLKDCKQELEFNSKLNRSVPPQSRSAQTAGPPAQSTVSAEKFSVGVTETRLSYREHIGRHKFAAVASLLSLVAIGLFAFFAYSRFVAGTTQTPIDSLAVLPFTNETGDAGMDYLSDGLSESLINNLSQLSQLKVIARSSAFRYKGKEIDPQQVAMALDVKSILTGRVMRYGDSLQINVELMDARNRAHVWGAQYNRRSGDLVSIQQEIAHEISRSLQLQLSTSQESRVSKLHTSNSEAYELYLKGRFYWNKRTGESLLKSVEYFNQAIEKDPAYALAYVGLADAYIVIPFFSVSTPQEAYPKAKAAAQRALEIDDSLVEAHTAMAAVLIDYDWNLAESNREFERAIELNPNYANAHHWYARENLVIAGEFDRAIAEMERARALDPLSLIINANLGKCYFNARRYDEAIQQLKKTIDIDPTFFVAHHYLGSAYAMKGDYQEALGEYKTAHELNKFDPHVVALMGRLYALMGRKSEADAAISELKSIASQRYVADYSLALVYEGLHDKNTVFKLLDQSFRAHSVDMLTLYYDPLMDSLHDDPRYAELLRRVGLRHE